jgi:aldehyde:ferredoxin oxidoreductase
MPGWTGKLLRVNLTTGECKTEAIPKQWLKEYVGGRGLAARYLYEELDPTVEPLSPENKLIFATGPLTGTPVPCGARYMVVTKGALTNAITTSNSGGHWGPRCLALLGQRCRRYRRRFAGRNRAAESSHLLHWPCWRKLGAVRLHHER